MLENDESHESSDMSVGVAGNVSKVVKAPQKENGGKGVANCYTEDEEDDAIMEDVDERVFSVGDFVWGKIRNHPWWPGQIYHASDASDLALKHKPKDNKHSYLVAYFGDGTFSWSSAAHLKIFYDHFESMSCQSTSKGFMFAVEDALCVIGEVVALEMKCSCVLKDGHGQVGFARPAAENTGIRKGVYVPMVTFDRLAFVARFDAAAIVDTIKNAAWSISVKNKLVLTMLTSKLLAFYRTKGYRELPKYYFPVYIDGLEDISKRADFPVDGFVSDELKLYERRKQTDLADIIKEEPDTDVHNDKDFKEKSVSREGRRRRRRKSVGDTYSSKKDRSKGRTMVGITRAEKDGAIKLRGRKKEKDSCTPVSSVTQVRFEPMILNLHKDDGEGERISKAAKLIAESPPIRKQCNIIFEKEPTQECIAKDEERLLLGDETMKVGRVGNGIDLMPKEMISGIRPATFTLLPERPFGSRLDAFSLNKVSNYHTLMKLDNDDDDGRQSSAILFLTFSPGVSLPSKADLYAKYCQFGALNEEETDVLPNSLCAQVVFIKKSDGEQAFDYMVKMNHSDSGVSYRIRYIPHGSKFQKLDGPKTSPQLRNDNKNSHHLSVRYLKQKFETMISKLSNAEGDTLSSNMKSMLHMEMTNLLQKLS